MMHGQKNIKKFTHKFTYRKSTAVWSCVNLCVPLMIVKLLAETCRRTNKQVLLYAN
jgi:hypothetical protein